MVLYVEKPIDVKVAKKSHLNGAMYGGNEQLNMRACFRKFSQFSKRTDLHGFKYIVMEDLNVVERSAWALAVSVSIIVAIYSVVTAYKWYARNPIVTVIESTQGAIWDVPFPAVTICDLNLISRKAARIFANNVTLPENVTADFVFETVRLAPLLHSTYPVNATQKRDLYILQRVLDINDIKMETLFRKLSPVSSCNQLLERCMWKNSVYRCDQLFQQVLTLQTVCCTFNYYATVSTDTNLLRSSGSPRRVASCGYQTALTVLVHTEPDDYYSAFVASQGALVFIDDSFNIPDLDSPVRLVNPSSEVMIALSPERTYSTPGIRSFSPDQRQCYYNDEVKIGHFVHYSFHNCIIFQKMAIVKKACECVPFYYMTDDVTRQCNFNDIDCLEHVIMLDDIESYQKNGSGTHCLPECEHFNYHFEVALGALAKHTALNGHPFFKDVKLQNRSLLNVFFNDLVSTKYRRDVYLNWQNILAAFGGLLSLMLGFTLISGFDFVLFFTFKIIYDTVFNFINGNDTEDRNSNNFHKSNKINNQSLYYKRQWLDQNKKSDLRRW